MTKSGRRKTGISRTKKPSARRLAGTANTRIDPPHEPRSPAAEGVADDGGIAVAELPAIAQIPADEPVWEQVRMQADQLAAHLRARQRELDHREAELNSRIARFEAEERSHRLSREQREAELALREKELAARIAETAKRQQDVEKRLARLVSAESSMQRRLRETSLPGNSSEDARGLQGPSAVAQEVYAKEMAAARERMAAEHQQAMEELERSRQAVQRRADYVERSQIALKQLRADLGRMHRETLEIRLATEELWAQLAGAAPSAAITESLGRIRSKLADQYRQANAELAEERKELDGVRKQLVEQYGKLVEQKQQFEQWADACRDEFQQQASQLTAREQQIQRGESLLEEPSRGVVSKSVCLFS